MSDLTGSNARTYEFQFPQKLFDICKKLPAETDQWLNATNNKDEKFCIAVKKHDNQWIKLSIHDVDNNLFELLPDRWRCNIKTISATPSADTCETLLEVKPDVNQMEMSCTVKSPAAEESEVGSDGSRLGRGHRRKRSTFREMSSDYVMLSKRRSTRGCPPIDPDASGDEGQSQGKAQHRGKNVAVVAGSGSDVLTRQGTMKKSLTETTVVGEKNNEANCGDQLDQLADSGVVDGIYNKVKKEPIAQELRCPVEGQLDTAQCTNRVYKGRQRAQRNRKPYVAYEQVISDKRAAVAALSKHEYHCALCPSYVCYTSKTLHNHIVFKHKISSSAYQDLVATHPMDTTTSQFKAAVEDAGMLEDNPSCDGMSAVTVQTVAKPAKGTKKKQFRRTIDSVEKTIGCLVCSQQFVQRTSMIKHVKQMHMTLENTEEMLKLLEQDKIAHAKQLSPITVDCPVCSLELRGKRIITHMKKMHANEQEFEQLFEMAKNKYYSIRSKLSLAREPPDRVSCPYCGRQFARVSMRGHIRYRCRSNSERTQLFNCNLCGYCTPYEDHLRTHKLQHPVGAKGFVCHVCGRAYSTRAGLMVHTRIKHNIIKDKPLLQFRCPVCRKMFHYSTQLTRHMSVHKVDRDCECDLCSRTFKDEITLKRHRKTFHFNEYRYHCDKCGHGVEKRKYLERHRCGHVRQRKNRVIVGRDNTTDVMIQPVAEQQTLSVFVNENGTCSTISGTSIALAMDTSSAAVSTMNLGAISEWPGSNVEIAPKGIQQEQLLFVTADDATGGPDTVYEEVVIPSSAVITMMCEVANASGEDTHTLVLE